MPGGAQAVEHLDCAGVGGGVILLMLAVIGPKLGKRLLKHMAVAHILGRHKALNQLEHAVSHLVAVLVNGKRGPAVRLSGMLPAAARSSSVLRWCVQLKDHMGKSCCHGCSCRLSNKTHSMILGLRIGHVWNLNIFAGLEPRCASREPLPLANPWQLFSHKHVEDAG